MNSLYQIFVPHSRYRRSFYIVLITILVSCEGEEGPIGLSSLIEVTNENIGVNCEAGGIKLDVGIDINSNGSLDIDEIQSTSYICNGLDGDIGLTSVTSEPAGVNCEIGGQKIDSGFDIDGDGALEAEEIVSTSFVCNGQDGGISLVNISEEAIGANCSNGGIKIESGIDSNGDALLDSDEIQITRFICNGINGGFTEEIRMAIEYPLNNNAFDYYGTSSATYEFAGVGLIDFNKNNFNGLDSIVFTTNLFSFGDADAFVELYNSTDDVTILNSEIRERFTFENRVFVRSANLFDNFPETTIDLGIRVRSETNGVSVASGTPYLILYRSN